MLLASTRTCFRLVASQRAFTAASVPVRRLRPASTPSDGSAFTPPAHRCRLMAQSLCDMQEAGVSSASEATALAFDCARDDDEEDDDDDDDRGGKGRAKDVTEKEVMLLNPEQERTVTMEVRQGDVNTDLSVVSESSEKKTKRKMRRDKRKVMKKRLHSADQQDNFMSELPFCVTSPTTWKELGFPTPESNQKKRKRKRDGGGRVDSEEDAEWKKKKKKENQRPNYFISIPITNPQISSAVVEVQEAVLQQEPRLAKAMIPVPSLHITLLVTYLASQEQVDLASGVLAQLEPSVAGLLGGRDLVLPFSGIDHFRKEVVFVGLAAGQHTHTLESLAELLQSRFVEKGLAQAGSRGFKPHLTIMKLSRASKLRNQGLKRVDPALYSNYTSRVFGEQSVERLDLCSMLKKKQQNGYYHTETSLQLGGRRRSEPDEAELLRVSRRLVEDAVSRALQQYKQETLQNGGGPNVAVAAAAARPLGNAEQAETKTDTTANSPTDCKK